MSVDLPHAALRHATERLSATTSEPAPVACRAVDRDRYVCNPHWHTSLGGEPVALSMPGAARTASSSKRFGADEVEALLSAGDPR